MTRYASSDEHQPLMWLRGHALYAAHFVVFVYVVSMLVTTILLAANAGHLLAWVEFDSVAVLRGEVWRIFTYGFVNPPSLTFVVHMFLIGWFGRELEKFFGQRKFWQLFACLYFLVPLLFTAIGRWMPNHFAGEMGALAIFVAFATLYPGVAVYFGILAQWLALILVAIYSLIDLAYHDWVSLISLWVTSGFAHVYVRYERGHFTLPDFRFWRRKPRLRVLPDLKPEPDHPLGEIDTLLDKIAKTGMASLTAKERARLETARADLLKKKEARRG